jgi:hypothetical protein
MKCVMGIQEYVEQRAKISVIGLKEHYISDIDLVFGVVKWTPILQPLKFLEIGLSGCHPRVQASTI